MYNYEFAYSVVRVDVHDVCAWLCVHFVCAAMSFPATGVESAYRNNLKDVAKMLKTKHEDNYMVRSYL